MPRIPEVLIESIKRDVGCVAVLEARGLEFVAHGRGGDDGAVSGMYEWKITAGRPGVGDARAPR